MRRRFVNLILAGFIVGSMYDIVTDQEHWRFSKYPMFSGTWTSPTFTWLRVVLQHLPSVQPDANCMS